jgi:hypothetical protein
MQYHVDHGGVVSGKLRGPEKGDFDPQVPRQGCHFLIVRGENDSIKGAGSHAGFVGSLEEGFACQKSAILAGDCLGTASRGN